jgi:hypothetical protein
VYNNYIDGKLELSTMKTKTFILFAAEAINENMNFLADEPCDVYIDTLEQNQQLIDAVSRAVKHGMESAELISLTEQLMYWNVVAWADSSEFKLHELANSYFNELEGK